LTSDDYILGLFDLSGELMRFAITTMATSGSLPGSKDAGYKQERTILMDLRSLRAHFEALDTSSAFHSQKKMEVMVQSVEKVETAVYGMIVRGSERPKGWIPDPTDDRTPVESY
jgi:predicted translin family RNA/ssDNA-binding protein